MQPKLLELIDILSLSGRGNDLVTELIEFYCYMVANTAGASSDENRTFVFGFMHDNGLINGHSGLKFPSIKTITLIVIELYQTSVP